MQFIDGDAPVNLLALKLNALNDFEGCVNDGDLVLSFITEYGNFPMLKDIDPVILFLNIPIIRKDNSSFIMIRLNTAIMSFVAS